ncbi:MAG TPA: alpha/beta fold hydrolase [Sphingobacterium sp.]|nr:alpha/beta fold hydrolase [Sphingobacterium sp.]
METTHHEFILKGFVLENGTSLDIKIAYQTYGTLNAARDNVILYPTYFAGRHTDNEWLIGRGMALDPSKYFIIVPNMLGNGLSSSPSNTKGEYGGAHFPQTSIYDNVIAQNILLREHLGIRKIKLAIGWSLGALQVYSWSVLFSDRIEKMVAFGGASQTSDRFKIISDTVISALKMDENWKEGHYTKPPEEGLRLMAKIYCPWVYSHVYFKKKFYAKNRKTPSIEKFLEQRWEKVFLQFDANNLVHMLTTGRNGGLGELPGYNENIKKALRSIKAEVLLMPGSTDLFFPPEESKEEAQYIPNAKVIPIPSEWGHESGIGINKEDNVFIDAQLKIFLN